MASISKIKNVQPCKSHFKTLHAAMVDKVGGKVWLRWVRTPVWHQAQSLSAAAGGAVH